MRHFRLKLKVEVESLEGQKHFVQSHDKEFNNLLESMHFLSDLMWIISVHDRLGSDEDWANLGEKID